MSERQARELPKIEIGDTMFYLDLRLNEFREVDNFSNRINLNDLEQIDKGYIVIFDTVTKNLFEGDATDLFKRKEEELIWTELPHLAQMDPDGFKWLMKEYRAGTAVAIPSHRSMAYREHQNAKIEQALGKAGLLYKPQQQPPLLEKKHKRKNKGKKL